MPDARLWIFAGHDPSGGAGVRRDVLTARSCAPSLELRVCVTAWTRQGGGRPAQAWPRSIACIRADSARAEPARVTVIKIGLVPRELVERGLVERVLARLCGPSTTIVLDPVLGATAGGGMGASPGAYQALVRKLVQRHSSVVVTPNLREARALLGEPEGRASLDELALARLAELLHGASVLVKGGHGRDPARVRDRLWHHGRLVDSSRARVPGPDPRGTGCALATAIASGLAAGADVPRAVEEATRWLDAARRRCSVHPDGSWRLPSVAPSLDLP